ncbi:MAG: phosphoglucomutase/phosphomannomutase family protein, partial [Candidatus Omnitrophica bacterium]|nr:phosphoglucomutase/phosphomannomutase family protein [Candidatus Omnitrophota bacterium]
VTQAIADYINSRRHNKRPQVVVGYDTRFLSKEFADETAKVLSANNIRVLLSDRDVPTPVIAYHVIKARCAGGINFTASHNPPCYNGIKFSPESGGPAPPEVTGIIERNIARLKKKPRPVYKSKPSLIRTFDPRPPYLKQIEKIIDFKAIEKASLKIAVDCLYGTSRGYLDLLLKKHNCSIEVMHDYINPYFDGKRPEPAPENIPELIALVKKKRLNLGLATDGDADRFGIVDSDGTYITPNQVITLLFSHLLRTRRPRKKTVARTVATTHMIDAIARANNIEVIETPVGFKYFVDPIIGGDCVIAGEESGGLSMSGHLPEKDGILACLLITEMVAINKKPIRDILKSLYKEYGRLYSDRIDLALSQSKKNQLIKCVKSPSLKALGGLKIAKRDTKDGVRLFMEDGSWVLFRPSGTEPIVRVYFESKSKATLSKLIKAGKKIAS